VSMVSDKSGMMSASAKSTLRCLVWPCDDEDRLRLSSTSTLDSELTLEPRHCMSVADNDSGELKPLDIGVSGVSDKQGDLSVDIMGLWSVSAEPRRSRSGLTHTQNIHLAYSTVHRH